MEERKKKRRRGSSKDRPIYGKGEVNMIIDRILHPLKGTHWIFTVVDQAFHMINEGNLEESASKFMKYSFPELVKKFLKKKRDDD